jgi:phosphoglycerate dehydrogenase-like enzyme
VYYDVYPAPPEEEVRPGARRASLDEVLAASDFVTPHVHLTPETHHFMNRQTFAKMKSSAMVISASRGPVVVPSWVNPDVSTEEV